MATQQAVIKKFMKSLDKTTKTGEAALNAAIKSASGSVFKNFTAFKKAMLNDAKNSDFLKTYCGIDYDTEDNGAITGSDAGGSTSKTDESVIPESGNLKTYKKTSFTKKGLTVKLGDGKTYKKLTADQQFIWNGLYTWWVEGALNLIEESYGTNFGFGSKSSATVKEMSVAFYNENSGTVAHTSSDFDDDGKTYKITLHVNMYHWKSLKDNLTKANNEFDRTIAHELTHAVMHVNINGWVNKSLPCFIREGLCELTRGIENYRDSDIKNLAKNPSKLSEALALDTDPVTVSGISNPSYAGGYMALRYLARQTGDLTIKNETSGTTVQTFYGNDKVTNLASKVEIYSGAGNDSIYNWDWDNTKVTIDSGSGNDVIANVGASTTIDCGSGNDSIHNWNDNVKIYCGSGNDTVLNDNYYDKANKVTIDGGSGNDKIYNYGNNVNIIGGSGADTVLSYGLKATIDGGAGADYLVGDTAANKIYGGSGNDSLWGGAGNDTLWGDSGNDTFVYTANEGTDRIMDYESGDILTILDADGNNGSFKSSKYSGGDLTLTINGGGKIIFDDVSKSDIFNINGTSYKISGSKLKKQ